MSGVEFIVGTVLGAVPLVLYAFDKYGKVSEAISTFRSPREFTKLQTRVGTQRTIFRNNSINLLSAITNQHEEILAWFAAVEPAALSGQNPPNPGLDLHMDPIYHERVESLKDSFESCSSTLKQLERTLTTISDELSGLVKVVEKMPANVSVGSRQWWSRAGGRMRFALRKDDLGKAVDELRGFSEDFGVLTTQIVAHLNEARAEASEQNNIERVCGQIQARKSASVINQLESYRQIRQASYRLYDTLSRNWTCTLHRHDSHAATVACTGPPDTRDAPVIKFNMALTILSNQKGEMQPLLLEVESLDDRQSQSRTIKPNASRSGSLDELRGLLGQYPKKFENTKKVRFDAALPKPLPNHQSSTILTINPSTSAIKRATEPSLVDLLLVSDFCHHLHTHYYHCQTQQCLGYLKGQYLQQNFYSPSADRRFQGKAESLSSMISRVYDTSIFKTFPLAIMFHIAGSLAASVLQFYSTPWLPETWCSQDVKFFNSSDVNDQDNMRLSHPYFKAIFTRRRTANDKVSRLGEGTASSISGARNELLFRFGILLLEVGFSRSWSALKEEVLQQRSLPPNKQSDYHIAGKLASMLTRQVGSTYTKIIRKCIGCDFGLSEPQDHPELSEELQASFLTDVVNELQAGEAKLRSLG